MPVAAVGTLVLALVIACSNDELIMNCNHEYNYVTLYGVVGGWVRGLRKKNDLVSKFLSLEPSYTRSKFFVLLSFCYNTYTKNLGLGMGLGINVPILENL